MKDTIIQYENILQTILAQNYFSYNDKYYTCKKGVAMGSPLSSVIAEIYLQHYEKIFIKHWIDSNTIKYYNSYVDDIFIIFDSRRVTENIILNYMNSISKHLEFKMTTEDNSTISHLDLAIIRKTDQIEIEIFRKPSVSSNNIHARSNHPTEHKTAAYRYGIRRLKHYSYPKIRRIKNLT
jgi:hypothetical protein